MIRDEVRRVFGNRDDIDRNFSDGEWNRRAQRENRSLVNERFVADEKIDAARGASPPARTCRIPASLSLLEAIRAASAIAGESMRKTAARSGFALLDPTRRAICDRTAQTIAHRRLSGYARCCELCAQRVMRYRARCSMRRHVPLRTGAISSARVFTKDLVWGTTRLVYEPIASQQSVAGLITGAIQPSDSIAVVGRPQEVEGMIELRATGKESLVVFGSHRGAAKRAAALFWLAAWVKVLILAGAAAFFIARAMHHYR